MDQDLSPSESEESEIIGNNIAASELVGKQSFEWTNQAGTLKLEFGKPNTKISLIVARVLGPAQAANLILETFYKSIGSIRRFWQLNPENGAVIRSQPVLHIDTTGDFEFLIGLFDDDDDLNAFTGHWHQTMNPELFKVMAQVMESGGSPEVMARVMENAQKQQIKK